MNISTNQILRPDSTGRMNRISIAKAPWEIAAEAAMPAAPEGPTFAKRVEPVFYSRSRISQPRARRDELTFDSFADNEAALIAAAAEASARKGKPAQFYDVNHAAALDMRRKRLAQVAAAMDQCDPNLSKVTMLIRVAQITGLSTATCRDYAGAVLNSRAMAG